MPHLTIYALEEDLAGRELQLISALTDATVLVYGEWAREGVDVRLIGLPHNRWGRGGRPIESSVPAIIFGIREEVFDRPDADHLVRALTTSVADAVGATFGEHARKCVGVEFVGVPSGRTGVGGALNSQ